ncbi:MAG: hypothetical protein KIS92_25260 [Planctomycetota bacterium]|nr:hypothetical protein [Planctomycetota bacterium]
MTRICWAVAVWAFCGVALRAADAPASTYAVPYPDLRAAAQDYLNACVPAKDVEAMAKKLKQQVETKVSDQGIDEDRAMREIMLDWAAGNESKIRKKDPKAIRQACFYFIKFIDKNFAMPWQIRDNFTEENVNKILEYLREEAKKAGGKAGEEKKK